jgi:hypothetical protein
MKIGQTYLRCSLPQCNDNYTLLFTIYRGIVDSLLLKPSFTLKPFIIINNIIFGWGVVFGWELYYGCTTTLVANFHALSNMFELSPFSYSY